VAIGDEIGSLGKKMEIGENAGTADSKTENSEQKPQTPNVDNVKTSQSQSLQQTVKEFQGTLQEIQQGIGSHQADKDVIAELLLLLKTGV
jgi:hypothetical protein